MLKLICGKALLVGVCLLPSLSAWGQNRVSAVIAQTHLDTAATYNIMTSNITNSSRFLMQGGSAQLHGQFWRGLGAVAEVSGLHTSNMQDSGVGLTLVNVVFGPRYTWAPASKRYSVFGQALGGVSNGLQSVFPAAGGTTDSSKSVAMELGGGVNIALSRRFSVRAIEADWLQTRLPNGSTDVQNNLRFGSGLVLHIK